MPGIYILFQNFIYFVYKQDLQDIHPLISAWPRWDGIPGILPVCILVAVIKFFDKPRNILLQAFHIGLHQLKHCRIKLCLFLIVQTAPVSVTQIPEVRQAEAFAV